MVVYFIMIADLLIGTAPTFEGVLPTLFDDHSNPWYLSRYTRLWMPGDVLCRQHCAH